MKNSKIEWTTHTFNGWIGCTKVSPGCLHCYAESRDQRFNGGVHWGAGAPRQRTTQSYWHQPHQWNSAAVSGKERPRVFSASLSDWLDDEVPVEWTAELLGLIRQTRDLDWLLLTKRPQLWKDRISSVAESSFQGELARAGMFLAQDWFGGKEAPPNVWIGVSAEDQPRLDERRIHLRDIPAVIKFLSCEPLLGPLDLLSDMPVHTGGESTSSYDPDFQWVIVGGESGPQSRACDVDACHDIVRQCRVAGVKPFVKQLGARPTTTNANLLDWPETTPLIAEGVGAASARIVLNDKKGGDWSEWPEELRVREFPHAHT